MCRVDYCEDDVFCLSDNTPVARKGHHCGDCGREIVPGERYRVSGWISDGQITRCKMCAHCEAAAEWLRVTCNGWVWTQIGEELREHIEEEPMLETWSLHWLAKAHRQKWRRRDGRMVSVEQVEERVERALVPIRKIKKDKVVA